MPKNTNIEHLGELVANAVMVSSRFPQGSVIVFDLIDGYRTAYLPHEVPPFDEGEFTFRLKAGTHDPVVVAKIVTDLARKYELAQKYPQPPLI